MIGFLLKYFSGWVLHWKKSGKRERKHEILEKEKKTKTSPWILSYFGFTTKIKLIFVIDYIWLVLENKLFKPIKNIQFFDWIILVLEIDPRALSV